jgi:hypothetical protein
MTNQVPGMKARTLTVAVACCVGELVIALVVWLR